MTGENVLSELAARPELNKEDIIRLIVFGVERGGGFQLPVISSRLLTFPDRPPRGITVPLKIRVNIITLEESLPEVSLFNDVVCYIGHVINSFNSVTWLTGIPARGLQSHIRKCLQWLFTKTQCASLFT